MPKSKSDNLKAVSVREKTESLIHAAANLSENDFAFLLAYFGIDPPGPIRTPAAAYAIVHPDADLHACRCRAASVLRRVRTKGVLTDFLEMRGLDLARIAEVIEGTLQAESVELIKYKNAFDYVSAPDWRTRQRGLRMLTEIMGVTKPSEEINVNVRTFAEAAKEQREERRRQIGLKPDVGDAEFTESDE